MRTARLVALLSAIVLAACSGAVEEGATQPAPAESPPAESAPAESAPEESESSDPDGPMLVIQGFEFEDLTVAAGAEILIDNRDSAGHTVTGDGFDVSVSGGSTATFTAPDSPGAYEFVCTIHPTMVATLTVE